MRHCRCCVRCVCRENAPNQNSVLRSGVRSGVRSGLAQGITRRLARAIALGVAVVVGATVVLGCGVPEDEVDRPVRRADVQFGLLDPVVTTTSTTTSSSTTTLVPPSIPPTSTPSTTSTSIPVPLEFYLIQNQRLVRVRRPTGAEPTVDAVLDALRRPTFDETLGGRRSILAESSLDVLATSGGGSASVDLGESFSSLLGSDQTLAIGQLVYSLTTLDGIGDVAFFLAGSPLEVPGADGGLISGPISRDDLPSLVATPSTTTLPPSSSVVLPPSV
jgi:Sporulation and spore germination